MVLEHRAEYGSEWKAIEPIATKIGCSPETLRKWIQQTEVDTDRRDGLTSDERARIEELEREVREFTATTACSVVTGVRQSRGPKSDKRDAFQTAEQLRIGSLESRVYKGRGIFSKGAAC